MLLSKIPLGSLIGIACSVAASVAAQAAAPADACQVLSGAQVSAAVGATVEEGTHVTPTFTKTCTWVVKNGGIIVTLNIEELAMFDAAKRSASLAGAQTAQASGVGDEAFYIDVGGALALHTKKGGAAFKVAVYSTKLSPDQKKSIERVLAQQAAAKF